MTTVRNVLSTFRNVANFFVTNYKHLSLNVRIALHDKDLGLIFCFIFLLEWIDGRSVYVLVDVWFSWRKILLLFFLFFFFNICVIRLRVLNLWRWFFFILNWHSLYFLSLFSLHVLFSDFNKCGEAHAVKRNECHPNATCTDNQGSYNCSWNPKGIRDDFNFEGVCLVSAVYFRIFWGRY